MLTKSRYRSLRWTLGILALGIRMAWAAPTIEAPASAPAGSDLTFSVAAPTNPRDFVTIVPKSSKEGFYTTYQYLEKGGTLKLRMPPDAGDYELRVLGSSSPYPTLVRRALKLEAVTATIEAPAQVAAGAKFDVKWTGPKNERDYIGISDGVQKYTKYIYTNEGSPMHFTAPDIPGKLQKLGSQRRIDIARQTLTKLTSSVIPAGTPFAMRVFGREVNSCQTDLFIPLKPLDAAAVGGQIAKLEAKNGAKTPIGASLAKVAEDLASVKGERLVVLLTDGEETCDGNPAAEIEKLQKAGLGVRVSIVGFAIEEANLALTFRQWAKAGNGAFFEAKDAAGLNNALAQAMRPGFEVVDAKGTVLAEGIAGGEAVSVMPGSYSVRLKGQKSPPQNVTVKQKEASTVKF